MANINKFLSHFSSKGEFSKTARFDAQIFLPGGGDTQGLTLQCEAAELPGYNINTVDGKVYGAPYQVAATPIFNELRLTFICAGDLNEKGTFEDWMDLALPMGLNNNSNQLYRANYRDSYIGKIIVTQYYEYGVTISQDKSDTVTSYGKQTLGMKLQTAVADTAKSSILNALGVPTNPEQFNNKKQIYADNLPNVAQPSYKVTFEEVFPYSMEPISVNWQDDGINRLTVAFKYKKWSREFFDSTRTNSPNKGLSLNDKLQQGLTTLSSIRSLLR